ncbi:unnamed protein product [Trichobilharzia szidati]|nr:unnamed protein product [Trichobilharzia szidati]
MHIFVLRIMITKRCALLSQILTKPQYHYNDAIITTGSNSSSIKLFKCFSSESFKKLLPDEAATDERITDVKAKYPNQPSYRFVPSKPIWKRFDVGDQNGLETENNVSCDEDSVSIDDEGVYCIHRSTLPERTQLDLNSVKLLEQVSLVDFKGEESLKILEEAIRYADCLLTKEAFHGTTNDQYLSFDNTDPIISLCDEINPDWSCPLRDDDDDDNASVEDNCSLASHIMQHVPDKWEGYIVAPLSTAPVSEDETNHKSSK